MSSETSDDQGEEFIKASELVDAGRREEAIEVFKTVIARPIHDFYKSIAWINIAVIREQLNQPEEALRAYDQAIALEESYNGYSAKDIKGSYLANSGSLAEAKTVFDELLNRGDLKAEDRERIISNLEIIRAELHSKNG